MNPQNETTISFVPKCDRCHILGLGQQLNTYINPKVFYSPLIFF